MSIAKVIKGYFIFVMIISSIAMLSYNDTFESYVLSVLHIGEASASADIYTSTLHFDDDRKVFSSTNESSSLLNFTIMNNAESAYAAPGSEDVKMMEFLFKTGDEVVLVKEFKLKVVGIDPDYIEEAFIVDGNKIIRKGDQDDEYFTFDRLDKKIAPNSSKTLRIYVTLSSDLHTGQRFRMDIESPEDIVLYAGDGPFAVDDYYPIEGKYLSIAAVKN